MVEMQDGPETAELMRLSPTIDFITRRGSDLLACVTEERQPQFLMRLHRLQESAARLVFRLQDFHDIERQMAAFAFQEETEEHHHYLQVRLLDRIDAFHQQIYVCVSTLVTIPAFVGPDVMKKQYPIGSAERFLNQIKEQDFRYSSQITSQIELLLRSRDYRSKFIDHPQEHVMHDWMTQNNVGKLYIIHFLQTHSQKTVPEEGRFLGDIDPFSPNYRPPLAVGDNFYVAPPPDQTYEAFQVVATAMLRKVLEEHQRRRREQKKQSKGTDTAPSDRPERNGSKGETNAPADEGAR